MLCNTDITAVADCTRKAVAQFSPHRMFDQATALVYFAICRQMLKVLTVEASNRCFEAARAAHRQTSNGDFGCPSG